MRPFKGIYKKHMEAGTKPPLHFHRYQQERFDVIDGDMTVEVDGVKHRYTKNDPVVWVPPYAHHVIYGTPGVVQEEINVIVSSVDMRKGDGLTNNQLDRLFFENWYGYQEDVFRAGGNKFDTIQVLSVSMLNLLLNHPPLTIRPAFRCWGHLRDPSMVGALSTYRCDRTGHRCWPVDWRTLGLSAFLS